MTVRDYTGHVLGGDSSPKNQTKNVYISLDRFDAKTN